jgi:hypothetical protein
MSSTKLEEDSQPMIGSLGRPIFVHKNQFLKKLQLTPYICKYTN